MRIQILILMLIVSCGKYSPNIKAEGETENKVEIEVSGEAEIRTIHTIELDICDGFDNEERKAVCIDKITEFLIAQSKECKPNDL